MGGLESMIIMIIEAWQLPSQTAMRYMSFIKILHPQPNLWLFEVQSAIL